MKKMSMSTLARGNLKGRRKQYLTLFFGVFFAMLFSMSALFFVSSFRASVRAKNERLYGKEQMILLNATHEDWSKLDQFFTEPTYGLAHLIGACNTEIYDESGERIVLSIGWLDDEALALSNAELIEGAYPTQEGEIAIEETALLRLNLADAKIGDEIELPVRVQNGSNYLPVEVMQRYTLTGILYDKASYLAHTGFRAEGCVPALQVAANTLVSPGGKENLSAYLHFQKQLFNDNGSFFSFIGGGENLLAVYHMTGIYSDGADNLRALYLVISIFAVSLLLVSCVGIVNAFQSRLGDRKTQIGLLRAVGTTRRQIVCLYSRETLILCLIATPPAFIGAFLIVRLLLRVIASGLIFTPQWWVLLGSAAISILVVLLASLIPLRRASRISPMQAIRNTEMTRTMANKKIKSQTSFDVSSLLSKRSRQLFKKRQALTSIMLTVSVLVAAFGFTMVGMYATQQPWKDGDYQLYCTSSAYGDLVWERGQKHGWTASELAEIQHISGITSASGWGSFPALIETDALTEYDKMLQLNLSLNLEEIEDLRLTPDMLTHFVPSASVERLKE
ncbi:MAG: ABC transporter permease, partial [Clostridia bacterium]|nr:ABC transporter permease [Clostridia bacterium]